jgi:hypothetical protein
MSWYTNEVMWHILFYQIFNVNLPRSDTEEGATKQMNTDTRQNKTRDSQHGQNINFFFWCCFLLRIYLTGSWNFVAIDGVIKNQLDKIYI